MSEGPESKLDRLSPQLGLSSRLRALTPARVGLPSTGVSQETRDLLDFQRCHAQARDAVHSHLEASTLAMALSTLTGIDTLRLHSAAPDRATYLQRPDLGRALSQASHDELAALVRPQAATDDYRLAIIVVDGLSALAVERHAAPLLAEFLPLLNTEANSGWTLTPLFIVEQGRVAIGDAIGSLLSAHLSIVLIGERPGLSAPDSLGAYITWEPRPGRTDAERNCISNIRGGGLSYAQAAGQLGYYLSESRRGQLTGVALKEQAPVLAEGNVP